MQFKTVTVYEDTERGHILRRTVKGPRRNRYTMTIAGWYAGGISAKTDTAARDLFLFILAREEAAKQ